ncbi:putative secreted protein [Aliiruegeria haliotis]|uniref:Putative secreted protein n=1 Tax=Aliiruegeria haliotis TaxID=1280846 RepID=A0A2T0RZ95_9RHOB|nr:hypothetical protein [Aliiruegeria haliotis]PRY26501.1 putative secreted protein [Aliiruegeria haliotis]
MNKLLSLVAAFALAGATSALAATVSPGVPVGTTDSDLPAAKWRGQNSGNELYYGVEPLNSGTYRNEVGFNWTSGASTPFTFSYNSLNGEVLATIGSGTPGAAFTTAPGLGGDGLVLSMRNGGKDGATISVTDMFVNGESVGGFSTAGFQQWTVSDFALAPVLSVTGNILFGGTINPSDSERTRFQIQVADLPPVPLPVPAFLLLGGLGGLVVLRKRRSS